MYIILNLINIHACILSLQACPALQGRVDKRIPTSIVVDRSKWASQQSRKSVNISDNGTKSQKFLSGWSPSVPPMAAQGAVHSPIHYANETYIGLSRCTGRLYRSLLLASRCVLDDTDLARGALFPLPFLFTLIISSRGPLSTRISGRVTDSAAGPRTRLDGGSRDFIAAISSEAQLNHLST